MQRLRPPLLRFALLAAITTFILHVVVLVANGFDPITSPIRNLSQGQLAELQHVALMLFGLAHIALAIAIGGLRDGYLWPFARVLLLLSGVGHFYIAADFAAADAFARPTTMSNDPLWVVASLTGLAMGAMQPGLSRLSLGVGLFGVVCLGTWLVLIPVNLLVTPGWLGGYERLVGGVYVIWMVGVSTSLLGAAIRAQRAAARAE
ncbi:MAG: hypothetical protein AAGH76_16125 [Pseudomonadota bacterium]